MATGFFGKIGILLQNKKSPPANHLQEGFRYLYLFINTKP